MISPKELWSLIKESINAWLEDRAASMGAALAYYTAFSIAPLLIIAIAVAGLVFGRDAAQASVVAQLQGLLGDAGGTAIEEILKSTADFGSSLFAMVIGVSALVVGATTAFVELQDDLDRIWKAEPRAGSGIWNLIRSRLLSFGMVLFIGFLLAVSLVLSAAVAALGNSMFSGMELLLHIITVLMSFAVITVLFAMIYKVLPNVKIAWENVSLLAYARDFGRDIAALVKLEAKLAMASIVSIAILSVAVLLLLFTGWILLILSLVAWLAKDWFSLPVSLLVVGLIIAAGAIPLIFLIKRHSGNLDFKATRRQLGGGS